jgi:hypothetical protein
MVANREPDGKALSPGRDDGGEPELLIANAELINRRIATPRDS